MSAQAHPLPGSALSAAHGLDRPSPGEFRAGGRQGGPIAFHSRALALVVLIHGLALAACFASRDKTVHGLANQQSDNVTVTLIEPARRPAEPAPPAPTRQLQQSDASVRHEEEAIAAPAPARSETAELEAAAAASPQTVAAQTAAQQAAPQHAQPAGAEAPQAARELAQLDCRVPEPEYPARSRRRGESGRVTLRLFVDERGSVSKINLVRSSGYPALDQAALRAAQAARCEAYVQNGQALAVSALQNFSFAWAD